MMRDLTPPPYEPDDPGPGGDCPFVPPVFVVHDGGAEDVRVTGETLARWLGLQAARMDVQRQGRELVHPSAIGAYERGAELPATGGGEA